MYLNSKRYLLNTQCDSKIVKECSAETHHHPVLALSGTLVMVNIVLTGSLICLKFYSLKLENELLSFNLFSDNMRHIVAYFEESHKFQVRLYNLRGFQCQETRESKTVLDLPEDGIALLRGEAITL